MRQAPFKHGNIDTHKCYLARGRVTSISAGSSVYSSILSTLFMFISNSAVKRTMKFMSWVALNTDVRTSPASPATAASQTLSGFGEYRASSKQRQPLLGQRKRK